MQTWECIYGVYHQYVYPLIRVSRVILSVYSCFSSAYLSNSFYADTAWVWGFVFSSWMSSWTQHSTLISILPVPIWLDIWCPWHFYSSIHIFLYLLAMTLCSRHHNRHWKWTEKQEMFDCHLSLRGQILAWHRPPTTMPPRSWIVTSDSLAQYPGTDYRQVSHSRWFWPTQKK